LVLDILNRSSFFVSFLVMKKERCSDKNKNNTSGVVFV